MKISGLLANNNWIYLNKPLLMVMGLEPTILLTFMCNKRDYLEVLNQLPKDEYFFYEQDEIEKETNISSYAQKKAIIVLINSKIIKTEKRKSVPSKIWYYIDQEILMKILNNSLEQYKLKNKKIHKLKI